MYSDPSAYGKPSEWVDGSFTTPYPTCTRPRDRPTRGQQKGVIHMQVNVALLLDKAISIHRLSSDYKLALVMGISHNSLSSYRHGKTLPDARVISLICDLTGDDAALIAAQIEEQRAKTTEARALWHQVVARLERAGAAAVFAVAFLMGGIGFSPMEAHASQAPKTQFQLLYIVECLAAKTRLFWRLLTAGAAYASGLLFRIHHVSRTASTAAA